MERTPRRGHWRYLTLALGLLAAHFLLAESSYAQKGRGFLQGRGRALEVVNDSVFPAVVVMVILATLLTSPLLKLANSSLSLP